MLCHTHTHTHTHMCVYIYIYIYIYISYGRYKNRFVVGFEGLPAGAIQQMKPERTFSFW